MNSNKSDTTYYKKRKLFKFSIFGRFKYKLVHEWYYGLKDKVVTIAEKINYDKWKRPATMKVIDIIWNSIIIALVIACLRMSNPFLLGIGVTLFLILLKSYVEEYVQLFRKR